MSDEFLNVLKDHVEGRLSRAAWLEWFEGHSADLAAQCSHFDLLRLRHRGFGGIVSVLEERGIPFQASSDFCHTCGEALFTAMPGKTTVQEIRAFAESSRLKGREHILRDGWIHPGQHCPNGCSTRLWHLAEQSPLSEAEPTG